MAASRAHYDRKAIQNNVELHHPRQGAIAHFLDKVQKALLPKGKRQHPLRPGKGYLAQQANLKIEN